MVILSGDLFKKLESAISTTKKANLKYTQSSRVASILHFVDSENKSMPDIYLVNEADYLDKYKD